jgi:hypothetical protein
VKKPDSFLTVAEIDLDLSMNLFQTLKFSITEPKMLQADSTSID